MKGWAMNPRGRSQPENSESGFTFVEIMIALTVGAIVIAGMYQGFNTLHKWWISSGIRSDMRQSARAGLETVTRDLEMAGYQTTNYGDVNKTGLAITLAATHEIEMDQQRVEHTNVTIDLANPVYEPRIVYYHLGEDKSGRQNLYRQIRTQPGQWVPPEIVAENVSDFTLAYLDKYNNPVDCLFAASNNPQYPINNSLYTFNVPRPLDADYCRTPVAPCTTRVPCNSGLGPDPLKNIRRITVTLTTIAARPAPFGPTPKPFTLTASVMPQNLGAADEVTVDTMPPATPSGPNGPNDPNALAVIDTQSCTEKLKVKWLQSTEPDLAGYRLYYGPTGYVDVRFSPVAVATYREYTLNSLKSPDLLITKSFDRSTAPNTYAIQIAAFDKSGNVSEKSASVAGNPSPDVTSFGGLNDTTVNPLKPSPPTALTVSPGDPAKGELIVKWPVAPTATVGYRLYRTSLSDFTSGGHIDGSLQIAGEAIITAQATDPYHPYRDKHLVSCTEYHYAVASVNCDETLVAGYHYNGTSAGDYAVASGEWRETAPPPAPSLAGSQAAEKQVLITLVNPLESVSPDFDRTVIYWNKSTMLVPSAPPHFDGSVISDGTPILSSDNGSPGTFKNRGSQLIFFDRETSADPVFSLLPGDTYNFLAVSYDRCGNAAAAPPVFVTIHDLAECADNPVGPPPAATDGTLSSCEPNSVVLNWKYAPAVPQSDLAGFRIQRTGPSGTVELTPGPTSLKTWTDAYHLVPGVEYTYTITATDCIYEQYLLHHPPWPSWPYPALTDTPNPMTLGIVKPGGLRRDETTFVTTQSDVPTSHTYHNNVRFFLQNTSRSSVTIKRMAVTWDKTNLVLDKAVIGGSPSSTTERTINVGRVGSGAEFSVNVDIADVAGGGTDAVPVLLRFTTPAGIVNRLADMREERLEISLWVANRYNASAECPTPLRVSIDVPRGPELRFFSQSAPGRDGIDSYAVIGPSGTARDSDIKVSTGIGVNVFGTVVDHSRELFPAGGFDTLKVVGADAAAAGSAEIPIMPASGNFDRLLYSLGCDRSIGGDRYAISQTIPATCGDLMPQAENKVHWYYALAVDKTGNWDRLPSPDYGNYAYFQKYPIDICQYTPETPGSVTATIVASSTGTGKDVILTWLAPSGYNDVDHTPIVSDDILTYEVAWGSSSTSPSWTSLTAGPVRSSLRFDYVDQPLGTTYYYVVRAKNSCFSADHISGWSDPVRVEIP